VRSAFATLAATVPTAVIALDFDPVLRLGGLTVRLETLGIALAILVALALTAFVARRQHDDEAPPTDRLRQDDLLFVALGVLPGALIGGRLGYGLLHLDYYLAHPGAIVDPSRGSLELGMAVAGGLLTGAYVAHLLGGVAGRWLHAATVPILVGLALGKLAMALGGDGQGLPSDAPWATAYLGSGPWGSLAPATAAHPAQVYEALASLLALGLVGVMLATRLLARRDGRAFLVAICLWALGRAVVATTWRDQAVAGPLRAGQLIALGLVVGCLLLLVDRIARGRSGPSTVTSEPVWPDHGQTTAS
jgi:prolipoprotein diacylglyceryltransferase